MDRIRNSFTGCLVSIAAIASTAVFGQGCSSDEAPVKDAAPTPHILALSTYSASLGTPIEAIIEHAPPANARSIELVFEGTFKRPDGRVEPVSLAQPTNRTEAGAVRWTSFGPFQNPFTPKDPDIGVFTGKLGVRVTNFDGTTTMDASPIPVTFEVKPSIILTELQPTTADCGKPSLRLIGAMAYKMKATTIGFKPTSIEYAFQTPGVVPDSTGAPALDFDGEGNPKYQTTRLEHAMVGPVDAIEEKEALLLPPVPLNVPSYGVVFAIVARDAEGRKVATTFGMTAHNPLEVYYDGRFELAQIYPATPVSSCIPGGQQGRNVDYGESQTETRQRQLSVTISKSWLKSEENNWSTSDGKTVTQSTTNTDGFSKTRSTSNAFSFTKSQSNTTGVSFNWSDSQTNSSGWTAGGSATVEFKPPLSPVGGSGTVSGEYRKDKSNTSTTGGGSSSSSTSGWTEGTTNTNTDSSTVDHSTATTDSTAVTKTNTKGGSNSEQEGEGEAVQNVWTVSSAQTIQRGFSASVIAGTSGVFYRQMARYTRRAFVLVYNKCGEGDVVGDLTLQDYVWAPDLALGEQCPPLPVSNFPQPQCYLSPCDP